MTQVKRIRLDRRDAFDCARSGAKLDQMIGAMRWRRSIREFTEQEIPKEIIRKAILIATNSPSGANLQPWRYAAISSPQIKKAIREIAEVEDAQFYRQTDHHALRSAVQQLRLGSEKACLQNASWLVAVFARDMGSNPEERGI